MVLAIDSANLFDLDAREEAYEERLFLQPVTPEKFLLLREPSTKQVTSVSLAMSGKKGNAAGAIRDFLEALIVTVDEAGERDEPELKELIEKEAIVDFDFLLDRRADPRYAFDDEDLIKLTRHIMGRATGFPTKQSSGSPTGPTNTGSSSPAASRRVTSPR